MLSATFLRGPRGPAGRCAALPSCATRWLYISGPMQQGGGRAGRAWHLGARMKAPQSTATLCAQRNLSAGPPRPRGAMRRPAVMRHALAIHIRAYAAGWGPCGQGMALRRAHEGTQVARPQHSATILRGPRGPAGRCAALPSCAGVAALPVLSRTVLSCHAYGRDLPQAIHGHALPVTAAHHNRSSGSPRICLL